MKDFKKFIKELNKDTRFSINESLGRKNTIKIVYIECRSCNKNRDKLPHTFLSYNHE